MHVSLCSGEVYRNGELHNIKDNLKMYFKTNGGPQGNDLVIPVTTAREVLLEVLYMCNVLHFVELGDAVRDNIQQYVQQLRDYVGVMVEGA